MAGGELKQVARNFTAVHINGATLYFSYETMVGYQLDGDTFVVCSENVWSQTTGKHLNMIQRNKNLRFPKAAFDKACEELEVL